MDQTIETRVEGEFTDEELNAVTGGMIRQPNNSTILINKPTFPPVVLHPQA